MPSHSKPSSGTPFHSLHATSHALQPMQIDVSVKKPTRVVPRAPKAVVPRAPEEVVPRAPKEVMRPSRISSGLGCDPGALPVAVNQLQQRRAAGATSGPDVTRPDLALLDVHVGIER